MKGLRSSRKAVMVVVVAALLAILLIATGCSSNPSREKEPVLKVGLIPNENHSEMLKINQPLKEYLEGELGMKVELFVAADYVGVIEAMNSGMLDIAYYGPLTYVLAREKTGAIPLVKAEVKGSPIYHSIIITRKDSGVRSVEDLRGKVFAFGDPASTSSHLMPNAMLRERGINPDSDLEKVFTGGHDAVALAVFNGQVAAGGMNENNYFNLISKGIIKEEELTVLLKSEPIPEYPWAARKDMDSEMVEKLIAAFVKIDDEAILQPQLATGFVPAKDSDYDVIRSLVSILGIDLEQQVK
jgi:phosphonate transport system substrate-binding protein